MFEIKDNFYLDGEPFQIISGAVHYFRTVPEYWRDRLEKLCNMGCNTVETYIPWNFHEPARGDYLWDGMQDICRFIKTAEELGLYMIIRPSPYICAEWEFGGLPAWLLATPGMKLRCSYKPYLDAVYEYYSVLMPMLAPYQIDRGGNIILMQIENEYGYYGDDTAYLQFLADTMREFGITVPFVTSDGPWGKALEAGRLSSALPTGNFGSHVKEQFESMAKRLPPDTPLMCMEFWVGWFDAWGQQGHNGSDLEQNKKDLEDVLKLGHLNFYMFSGGTNFGFMNGTNQGAAAGDVTSYDYDGILTEDGQLTPKYHAFKEIIGRHRKIEEMPLSTEIRRKEYGRIPLQRKTDLFSNLDKICVPITSSYPLSMEETGQNTGYILYRTRLKEQEWVEEIRLEGAADRVQGFVNRKHIFTAYGENLWKNFAIPEKEAGAELDFLVENCGRVNFGAGLEEQRKGIVAGIRMDDHRHYGYEIYNLHLEEEQIGKLDFSAGYTEGAPAFYEFALEVDEPGDTFLDFAGFGKGCAFVNGTNIGRFWDVGPQRRLYLPAPFLKKGRNVIILFETEGKAAGEIYLSGEPKLE